jgi:hypothetical protein
MAEATIGFRFLIEDLRLYGRYQYFYTPFSCPLPGVHHHNPPRYYFRGELLISIIFTIYIIMKIFLYIEKVPPYLG